MRLESRRLAHLDPALLPLYGAGDERGRAAALEAVIVEHVRPVAARVLARYGPGTVPRQDAEDIGAIVVLRFLRRVEAEERIERLDDYIATLTYNAVYDYLRRKHPERTRLKNRIRYLGSHDPLLAMWDAGAGPVIGLAAMNGRGAVALPATAAKELAVRDALLLLLKDAGGPLLIDDVVRVLDATPSQRMQAADALESRADELPGAELERRETIEAVWREVLQLPPEQRAALLLNLRDADGHNAVTLVLAVGIATIEQIAVALGLTPESLKAIWNDLPLDDMTIASMLGATRQRVINLRKSARERLTRRLRRNR